MQRKGGYNNYLGKEDKLQIAVINYIKLAKLFHNLFF